MLNHDQIVVCIVVIQSRDDSYVENVTKARSLCRRVGTNSFMDDKVGGLLGSWWADQVTVRGQDGQDINKMSTHLSAQTLCFLVSRSPTSHFLSSSTRSSSLQPVAPLYAIGLMLQGRYDHTLSVFRAHVRKCHYSVLRDENKWQFHIFQFLKNLLLRQTFITSTRSYDLRLKIDSFVCLMRDWLTILSRPYIFWVHTLCVTVNSLQGNRSLWSQIANRFSTGANELGRVLDSLERHFKAGGRDRLRIRKSIKYSAFKTKTEFVLEKLYFAVILHYF